MNSLQGIHDQFKERGYALEPYRLEDNESLYKIFRQVVDDGDKFPYEDSSKEEFLRRFFDSNSQVYVCKSANGNVVGGFYIRPNYPGRAAHIANCAYMIDQVARGKGLGTLLAKASLLLAKKLGFMALMYNMVLSQNKLAIDLYKNLGFTILATIPNAIRKPDGAYQDGHVMYRSLENLESIQNPK